MTSKTNTLKKLFSVAGACSLIVASGLAFLVSAPQSEAQILKRVPAKPYTITKYCGAGFSKSGGNKSYQCSMTVEHYCPSGYVKSAMVINGNKIQYGCTLGPS